MARILSQTILLYSTPQHRVIITERHVPVSRVIIFQGYFGSEQDGLGILRGEILSVAQSSNGAKLLPSMLNALFHGYSPDACQWPASCHKLFYFDNHTVDRCTCSVPFVRLRIVRALATECTIFRFVSTERARLEIRYWVQLTDC